MSGPPVFYVQIGGDPVPADRPRFDSRTRRTYTPPKYDKWKRDAAIICAAHWKEEPIYSAVAVLVEVTLPRPATKPRSPLHARFWHPSEDYPIPLRGDADNYAKAALDALTQGRVIVDDRLVVELTVTKYAGSVPGVEITVSMVDPETWD